MKVPLKAFLAFLMLGAGVVVFASTTQAQVVAEQQTNWGLDTFGESRSVADFSSLGWALEEIDGAVYSGGNFLNVTNGERTESQPYLASFRTTTGKWVEDFRPEVGGPVLALEAANDGALFVGGEMDTWNGQQVGALAKIDPATGELIAGWNTRIYGGNATVRNLSLESDGWLYVVGSFTTASDANNPQTVRNVVRMNPDTGAIDWSWLPQLEGGGDFDVSGSVWGVAVSKTQPVVYLAGWFQTPNGEAAVGISSTDASQIVWDEFEMNYRCCDKMYDVETTTHGTVFFVGEQHGAYMYDENNNMALMINHVTSYNTDYQDGPTRRGGDYQDVELVGDTLYATCHCWGSQSSSTELINLDNWNLANVDTAEHTGRVSAVIAYDAATGVRDQSFNPYMAGDVGGWAVHGASDGCVWVTGGINAVGEPGSEAPGRDLVRLCDADGGSPADVPAPASCVATTVGSTITVTWDGVNSAQDFVIYRNVDGGVDKWRGVSTATEFVDTNRDATLLYSVAARLDGRKSAKTVCSNATGEPDPNALPAAPASCSFVREGDDVNVSWEASPDAENYIVYRSVDASRQYWRGATAELTFVDSNKQDVALTYFVVSKSETRMRSEATPCEEGNDVPPPPPEPVTPVASCEVTQDAQDPNSVEITWPAIGDLSAEYVIYRSVDGGTQFWRGKTSETSFADTLRAGSIEYFVDVKLDKQRSVRVACVSPVEGV